MKYYSQYGQDEWAYKNYLEDVKNGTFLEIGADDGVDKSNTKFFEDHLGWSGICIEASPSRFELLKKNRKCVCECAAVSDEVKEVQFLDIRGWGKGLSGIVKTYDNAHVRRIQQEMTHDDNDGHEYITLKTELLNDILERNAAYEIDFCTIDTEGSEFEILRALDFDKFKIKLIMVENNYNETNVRDLLVSKGYKFVGRVGPIDDAYVLDV